MKFVEITGEALNSFMLEMKGIDGQWRVFVLRFHQRPDGIMLKVNDKGSWSPTVGTVIDSEQPNRVEPSGRIPFDAHRETRLSGHSARRVTLALTEETTAGRTIDTPRRVERLANVTAGMMDALANMANRPRSNPDWMLDQITEIQESLTTLANVLTGRMPEETDTEK